ncbi:50S ribosomal protein L28 [bacterium]|jgi:large subunit ribosomal protein L28|nr:50S ribosomal protein L28 [bacterium]MBT6831704.1 50S ribosomal protein L28 [bacterium]MBT6996684.1 50S ribosomal protein L28 [bacterium]MBT7772853.1 50S ribosomal protein L28 [bacterium]
MSRQCQLTGKKTTSGQNRPFSLKATKRTFRPNLFLKKMFNPLTGKVERMKLSAKAIKTLKKWAKEKGFETEVEKIAAAERLAAKKNNTQKTTNEEKGRVKKVKLTPKQKKEIAEKEAAENTGKDGKTLEEALEVKKEETK